MGTGAPPGLESMIKARVARWPKKIVKIVAIWPFGLKGLWLLYATLQNLSSSNTALILSIAQGDLVPRMRRTLSPPLLANFSSDAHQFKGKEREQNREQRQ